MTDHYLALPLLGLLSLAAGCASFERLPSADSLVTNGIWREQAQIDMTGIHTLVLPEGTSVIRAEHGSTLSLSIAKKLHYLGHPTKRMSIETARKHMTCEMSPQGKTLLIAKRGEKATPDGGTSIELACVVPPSVETIEYAAADSADMDGEGSELEWSMIGTTDAN